MNNNKFKEWFKNQSKEDLDTVYDLLNQEYKNRGLDIVKDRGFYRSSENYSDIRKSMQERFNYDEDSGSGQWC